MRQERRKARKRGLDAQKVTTAFKRISQMTDEEIQAAYDETVTPPYEHAKASEPHRYWIEAAK